MVEYFNKGQISKGSDVDILVFLFPCFIDADTVSSLTCNFYTTSGSSIQKTQEDFTFSGNSGAVHFQAPELDALEDGVLRYTASYDYAVNGAVSSYTMERASNYFLKSPVDYVPIEFVTQDDVDACVISAITTSSAVTETIQEMVDETTSSALTELSAATIYLTDVNGWVFNCNGSVQIWDTQVEAINALFDYAEDLKNTPGGYGKLRVFFKMSNEWVEYTITHKWVYENKDRMRLFSWNRPRTYLNDQRKIDLTLVELVKGQQIQEEGIKTCVLDFDALNRFSGSTLSAITDIQYTLTLKQDELVSGTNIKTIHGQSILGEGNIDIVGPQGPQGDRGIEGPQGSRGVDGTQGPQGDKGADGLQGPQGDRGEQGPQGERGIDGADGPQGPQGDRGIEGQQGSRGVDGAQGPQGDMGAQGPQGEKGEKGDGVGVQGPQGDRGEQGPQGDIGAQGPQGDRGVEGPQGATGVVDYSILSGYTTTATTEELSEALSSSTETVGIRVSLTGALSGSGVQTNYAKAFELMSNNQSSRVYAYATSFGQSMLTSCQYYSSGGYFFFTVIFNTGTYPAEYQYVIGRNNDTYYTQMVDKIEFSTYLPFKDYVKSSTINTIWTGTQNDYDLISPKDPNTLYIVQ